MEFSVTFVDKDGFYKCEPLIEISFLIFVLGIVLTIIGAFTSWIN